MALRWVRTNMNLHIALRTQVARLSGSYLHHAEARAAPAVDTIPTDMEQSTGLERRELEAMLAGDADPFNLSLNRGPPGTRDNPTLVPSMFDERIVGCVCEEDSTSITWMVLKKGELGRCTCGNCFRLISGSSIGLPEEH